jgi:hypothetical protein
MKLSRTKITDDLRSEAAEWCAIYASDRGAGLWSVKAPPLVRKTSSRFGMGGALVPDTDDRALELACQLFLAVRAAEHQPRPPHVTWAEAAAILNRRERPPYRPIRRRRAAR